MKKLSNMRFGLAVTSRPIWKVFDVTQPVYTVLLDNEVLDIRAVLSKAADWLRSKRKRYPNYFVCVFELDSGYVIANYKILDL